MALDSFEVSAHNCSVDGEFRTITKHTVHALPPSKIFAALSQNAAQFKKTMLGGEDPHIVAKYWQHVAAGGSTHRLATDPGLDQLAARTVPIYWHVDGVEIYNGTSYTVYSWCSPLACDQNVYDFMIPCLVIEASRMVPGITEKEIVTYLESEHVKLRAGVNDDGELLARGWCAN